MRLNSRTRRRLSVQELDFLVQIHFTVNVLTHRRSGCATKILNLLALALPLPKQAYGPELHDILWTSLIVMEQKVEKKERKKNDNMLPMKNRSVGW